MIVEELAAAVYLTAAFVVFFLGLAIYRHGPQRTLNRVAAWMLFFAALGATTGGLGLLSSPSVSGTVLAVRLASVWELFFPTLLTFSLLYPRKNPMLEAHPQLVLWIYFPYAFHLGLLLLVGHGTQFSFPNVSLDWARGVLIPVRIVWVLLTRAVEEFVRFHMRAFALVDLVYAGVALALLGRSFQSVADPQLSRQGRLVVAGLGVGVGAYALAFLVPRVVRVGVSPWFANALLLVALVFSTAALAWAIVRYQFLDVRAMARRGLVLSAASGLVAGLYLLTYTQVQRLSSSLLGFRAPVLEVFFVLVAVFLFQPLVQVLESSAERLFAREVLDLRTAFQKLSEDLVASFDLQELASKLRERLGNDLGFSKVELWVNEDDVLQRVGDEATLSDSQRERLARLELPILAAELNESKAETPRGNPDFPEEALLLPLRRGETFLGLLSVTPTPGNRWSSEELALMHTLAGQVAIAVENVRLHREQLARRRVEEELALARDIQRELLPARIPSSVSFEFAALTIPSREVGGDLYDFVEFSTTRIGVALGDVSGKGVPASLLMANILAAFRVLATPERSPAEVVSALNRQLARSTTPDRYATFVYGHLDADNLRFTYCNAGHNYPLIRWPDGSVRFLEHSDMVLGVLEDAGYSTWETELLPGSCLVLYTDGVTEAFNPEGEEYGEERLLELVAEWGGGSAAALRDRILEAIREFGAGRCDYDDVTMIIARVV
ncbi:MAG: PP2C family protein-serine/threonine phosphatase [Calditrichaeota bacterium]|nr:PP2C family protein-serine/threonine phosphatase [Calditrichota bacterium]